MKKMVFVCIFFIILFACVVFLIRNIWGDAWPCIKSSLWLKVILIVIVAPIVVLITFAKAHIGFKPRIIIRPFDTMRRDSRYDGKSVAVALYRHILARSSLWKAEYAPLSTRSHQVRTFDPRAYTTTIAVGGVTVSLEWICSKFRKWVVGDIEIQGLIDDEVKDETRILAWSTDGNLDRQTPIYKDPEDEAALTSALDSLSYNILWDIQFLKPDPIKLASIYSWQSRYNESLNAYEYALQKAKGDKQRTKIRLQMAWIYLDSDRYDDAIYVFNQIRENIDEVTRGLALAFAAKGEYDRSIEMLERQCEGGKVGQLLSALGDVYAYMGLYSKAIKSYGEVEEELVSELARWIGLEPEKSANDKESADKLTAEELMEWLSFSIIQLYRMKDKYREQVSILLWDLADVYGSKGRCYHIDQNPTKAMEEYRNAKRVLELLPGIALDRDRGSIYLQHGVRNEDIALYDEAIGMYNGSIEECKTKLLAEPEDITALTNLAWAYCGNFACTCKKIHQVIAPLETIRAQNGDNVDSMMVINALAELLQWLPETYRQEWLFAVWQANGMRKEEQEYLGTISEATARLVNAVLEEGMEEQAKWISKLAYYAEEVEEAIQSSSAALVLLNAASAAKIEGETIDAFLGSATISKARERADVRVIYRFIFQSINVIASAIENEYIDNTFEAAIMTVEKKETLKQTSDAFRKLGTKTEEHHKAESSYGFACVHSILGNIVESVSHLKIAINAATPPGAESSEYRNSAKLNSDFDNIRHSNEFKELIWGSPV